jgi:Mrp family chromosome partitioning ATPase
MARMLQALKNLEARSARPAAKGAAPRDAKAAPEPQLAATTAVEQRPQARLDSDAPAADELPGAWVHPARRANAPTLAKPALPQPPPVAEWPAIESTSTGFASALLPAWPSELTAPHAAEVKASDAEAALPPVYMPLVPDPPAATRSASPAIVAATKRVACNLERQVARTLSDPARSRPLRELADRLRHDARQTNSKTLVLMGVGPASTTGETLLYAATLLASEARGDVLLVDADFARRGLTEGLEFGRDAGLAELLLYASSPGEHCQSTARANLAFLPAGQARHVDLSAAGPRLEQAIRQLASRFSCVLIDGGRSGDLAAAALARQADATYLVVQLGSVETSIAQRALRDLRAAGARVLGCIAT